MKKIDSITILLVIMAIFFILMLGAFLYDFSNDLIELGNIIERNDE